VRRAIKNGDEIKRKRKRKRKKREKKGAGH
jgi:hypothetical protein